MGCASSTSSSTSETNTKVLDEKGWTELLNNIPIDDLEDNQLEYEKREELWQKGNPEEDYISKENLTKIITENFKIPQKIIDHQILIKTFDTLKEKTKVLKNEDEKKECLMRNELRVYLACLKQYLEYWHMFEKIENNNDFKITYENFKEFIPGIENPEEEFKKIDNSEDHRISYDDFCKFAFTKWNIEFGPEEIGRK